MQQVVLIESFTQSVFNDDSLRCLSASQHLCFGSGPNSRYSF